MRSVDGERRRAAATASQEARRRVVLVHDQRRLLPRPRRLGVLPEGGVGLVEEAVVLVAFDDQRAGHAVVQVHRGRAVLVRVIPMGPRRLTHAQARAGSTSGIFRQHEAGRECADVVLRERAVRDGPSFAGHSCCAAGLPCPSAISNCCCHVVYVAGRSLHTPGPWRQVVGPQPLFAVVEEPAEILARHGFGDDWLPVAPRRGASVQEDVVAGAVRVGVRTVEVDVARRRAVETIRVGIPSRLGVAGAAGVTVAPAALPHVDGLAEVEDVDLIEEQQLDDVAQARADCRPGRGAAARLVVGVIGISVVW